MPLRLDGITLVDPLDHLLATEAAHDARAARLGNAAIQTAFRQAYAENTGTQKKAAHPGGLLASSAELPA